ncbi:hypothetical protein BP6252_10447 [Coleophoma cylindrospora]|uniref:C2H2-type domain-containing protein n=1 Tax=Coleophoma cylindrospora TaxID=1849047 RepID=A0A3D8QSJ1_9HELO|nr:hypothetical protein BP6252_10447 [Coleophoma cylindrospora]
MSNQDKGKHRCPDCGRAYKAAETLKRHRKNHGAVPSHVCSVCSAGFRRNDLLQRHIKIHQTRSSRSPDEPQPQNSTQTSSDNNTNSNLNNVTSPRWNGDAWAWPTRDGQSWAVSSFATPTPVDVTANNLMIDDVVSDQFDPLSWAIDSPLQLVDKMSEIGTDRLHSRQLASTFSPPLAQSALCSAEYDSIVLDLVEYAVTFSCPTSDETLLRLAARIENKLDFHGPFSASEPTYHLLDHCVTLFFKHFHLLYPFLREHDFRSGKHANYLYMVTSGIGLIYLKKDTSMLYTRLLAALRERLTMLIHFQQIPEENLLSVCQALLLTQMGIWTFRGEDHVKTAELVGSTVVYLARRLNLFNCDAGDRTDLRTWMNVSRSEMVQKWIKSEEQKRLAFGIYRTQLCVAIVTGCRPAVHWEEMNLFIPYPDHLWHLPVNELADSLSCLAHAPTIQTEYIFADLIRVTLDRNEKIPDLVQTDLQLILFALQQQVQYFCYDPESKARLHSIINAESLSGSLESTTHIVSNTDFLPLIHNKYQEDLLEQSARKMNDVRSEKARLYSALEKWKAGFTASLTTSQLPLERSTLMTSHLLYSISIIALKSPLFSFQRLATSPVIDKRLVLTRIAYNWASSREAELVARHACASYSLLRRELDRPLPDRAPFDVLTEVVIFHCAVLVWVYSGVRDSPGELVLDNNERISLYRANSGPLMIAYASLLRSINPLRIGSSTFVDDVIGMSRYPLPMLEDTVLCTVTD